MSTENRQTPVVATRLTEQDCFYISERRHRLLSYPCHCHADYELTFVEHGQGMRRIVGDSCEVIGDCDLVLMTGKDLRHVWEEYECTDDRVREITLHFSPGLFVGSLVDKTQFRSIQTMLEQARCGLAFSREAIDRIYPWLNNLASEKRGFYAVMHFMLILHELSLCKEARPLSSHSLACVRCTGGAARLDKVEDYVEAHYMQEIRLADLAGMIGMTSVSFSRFFRQVTGQTFSDYLTQVRLGQAARLLVDSQQGIADICYDCGFNNLSNFNRMFKKHKLCSPKEFRESYRKQKIII